MGSLNESTILAGACGGWDEEVGIEILSYCRGYAEDEEGLLELEPVPVPVFVPVPATDSSVRFPKAAEMEECLPANVSWVTRECVYA